MNRLLEKTAAFYEKNFLKNPDGKKYLEKMGIKNANICEKHRLGYADGGLFDALPKTGRIIDDLKKLGVLTKDKKEKLADCVTIPISDMENNVIDIAGINTKTNKTIFLKDENALWNIPITKTYPEVYRTYKIMDALSLEEAGIKNVVCFGKNLPKGVKELKTGLPEGFDFNDYLLKHGAEELKLRMEKTNDNNLDEDILKCGFRTYELFGVEKNKRSLKSTVKAHKNGKLHVDTINFYSSRERRQLTQDLTLAFEELPETIESDMKRLLEFAEKKAEAKQLGMDKKEHFNEAPDNDSLLLGKSPDLIKNIMLAFDKCGVAGEDSNKLLCYLAMTSRKMDEPLSVMILSSSGAGKSKLMDATLNFCPDEDLVKLTNLSGKALFYKERTSLKHKVLALEEQTGAENASYAIRNLISSDGLRTEATIRNPATGKMETMENKVEGPASVFCSSANPDVDAETKSRFIVLGIDESKEQTRRILAKQRLKHTLEGLKDDMKAHELIKAHKNFQRALKRLKIINPLIDRIKYDDDRLQSRRMQPQHLNIADAVCFLRQMQKPLKKCVMAGTQIEYIEVDEKDVETANKLTLELFGKSPEELSAPSRNLLGHIKDYVDEKVKEARKINPKTTIGARDISFTRKDIRHYTGWAQTRLRIHLKQLLDYEYINTDGNQGRLVFYRLIYDELAINALKTPY